MFMDGYLAAGTRTVAVSISFRHAYVFVVIRNEGRTEFVVAAIVHVAEKVVKFALSGSSIWHSFMRADRPSDGEGWELFDDLHASPEPEGLAETVVEDIPN